MRTFFYRRLRKNRGSLARQRWINCLLSCTSCLLLQFLLVFFALSGDLLTETMALSSYVARLGINFFTSNKARKGLESVETSREESVTRTTESRRKSQACATWSSDCHTCTSHPTCRFCLLKLTETGEFWIDSSEKKQLRGHCIDLETTSWRKSFLVSNIPPTYGYCGVIVPDYFNGVTCFDADADAEDGEDPSLSVILQRTEDPAPIHSPADVLFFFIIFPIIFIGGCGCCTIILSRHCRSKSICCFPCCCAARIAKTACKPITPRKAPATPLPSMSKSFAVPPCHLHDNMYQYAGPSWFYGPAGGMEYYSPRSTAPTVSTTANSTLQAFPNSPSIKLECEVNESESTPKIANNLKCLEK